MGTGCFEPQHRHRGSETLSALGPDLAADLKYSVSKRYACEFVPRSDLRLGRNSADVTSRTTGRGEVTATPHTRTQSQRRTDLPPRPLRYDTWSRLTLSTHIPGVDVDDNHDGRTYFYTGSAAAVGSIRPSQFDAAAGSRGYRAHLQTSNVSSDLRARVNASGETCQVRSVAVRVVGTVTVCPQFSTN